VDFGALGMGHEYWTGVLRTGWVNWEGFCVYCIISNREHASGEARRVGGEGVAGSRACQKAKMCFRVEELSRLCHAEVIDCRLPPGTTVGSSPLPGQLSCPNTVIE